jgi:hypothetical protein
MDTDSNPTSGRSPQQRTGVFISYSHEDKDWLKRITNMLSPLGQMGTITIWHDTMIAAGAEWRKEIEDALGSARVAVLLVTPDFLASDFVVNVELPLLETANKEGLTILWIAVKDSLYDETAIAKYQAANNPAKPLEELLDRELNKELRKICKKIKEAATKELVSETSRKITPAPVGASASPRRIESEKQSRQIQYDPTEDLVDFEDQQNLFKSMLTDSPEKRLMLIQAQGGRGKTSLLRLLGVHCEQKGIPCCSLDRRGQPYDSPHFTLALVICDQLGVSPRHLAQAVQPYSTHSPQEDIDDPYTISQILAGVNVTNDSLRQPHIKERLKNAFHADLSELVEHKGGAVCLFDSFERLSAEEEDWLIEALLTPIKRGKLKGVMVVTAGHRWPKGNRWDWQNTHLVDGLPSMTVEHIKTYAEKLNIKITDEAAEYCRRFSKGIPLHMAMMVQNLQDRSEVA